MRQIPLGSRLKKKKREVIEVWSEDAKKNPGNQRGMKPSFVSLKEHTLGEEPVGKADGLARLPVELAFRDTLQVPNSVSWRYWGKIISLPVMSLSRTLCLGRMGGTALRKP